MIRQRTVPCSSLLKNRNKVICLYRKNKIKVIVGIIFFNIFMLWLFFANFYNCLPIKSESVKQINGSVDEIVLVTVNRGADYLNIFIDSERYVLSEIDGSSHKDLVKYVYEKFKPGDVVSIKYVTKLRLFDSYKLITEFVAENQKYRTIDEYNQSINGSAILYLILFVVFEFLNVSVLLFILWCRKPIK